MATTTATVGAPLDKARRDLSDATEAIAAYWGRSDSCHAAQIADVRSAVEALTRAVASVVLVVERVSNETAAESRARPMNKKQYTAAELQAILEQRAAYGDAGASAVLWVQRRRAAGLTRQMTGAECVDPQRITALYARFGR